MHTIPHDTPHKARWHHVLVELDRGRPLHVLNVYGYDAGQPAAAKKNGELMREITEVIAGLGAAWWIAGGDWNEEAADVWDLAVAEGRCGVLPRHDHSDSTVRPSGSRILVPREQRPCRQMRD